MACDLRTAHMVICQLITIGDRFSSFLEVEAWLRFKIRVGLRRRC